MPFTTWPTGYDSPGFSLEVFHPVEAAQGAKTVLQQ